MRLKRTIIVLCFVKQGRKPTSKSQALASFCGKKRIFATCIMWYRKSCILCRSITKVHGIWNMDVLKNRLVTFKKLFRSWKNENNSNIRWSLSNQAEYKDTYDFQNTFSLYINTFIFTCTMLMGWNNWPLNWEKVDQQVSWLLKRQTCYQVPLSIVVKLVYHTPRGLYQDSYNEVLFLARYWRNAARWYTWKDVASDTTTSEWILKEMTGLYMVPI